MRIGSERGSVFVRSNVGRERTTTACPGPKNCRNVACRCGSVRRTCVRPAWARTYGVKVPCGRTELDSYRAILTTSRRQGLTREGWSGRQARVQTCETTDRNRIEGPGGRGELAHDSKAHRFDAYGKCGACAQTVRDPYLGRSAPRAVRLNDDLPGNGSSRATKNPAPWRAARCVSKKEAATSSRRTARPAAMRAVMVQKSAAAIVGAQESGHPRAKQ
jgi:hypothetical protein